MLKKPQFVKLGMVSSLLLALGGALSLAAAAAFAAAFHRVRALAIAPGLLIGVAFVILAFSVHSYVPAAKKAWSGLSLVFAIVFAAVAGANTMIQLTTAGQTTLPGAVDGSELLAVSNPRSIFWALRVTGLGFFGTAALFAAPIYGAGGLERAIRLLLVLGGTVSVAAAAAHAVNSNWLFTAAGAIIFAAWGLILLITSGLIHLWFRR